MTATSDTIGVDDEDRLFIDEATVAPLIELWAEFALTPQQVEKEMELRSARTLAIRAANLVAKAQDIAIFQGQSAFTTTSLVADSQVEFRSGPAGTGLMGAVDPEQTIAVASFDDDDSDPGEQIFAAVTQGYAQLQNLGHYGPYALILESLPYADTFAPSPSTLILAADRIQPLVMSGFYGTGALPGSSGLLLSLGGDTMDLVLGKAPMTSFLFEDDSGEFRFRVLTRFALRLKDRSAVIRFEFGA